MHTQQCGNLPGTTLKEMSRDSSLTQLSWPRDHSSRCACEFLGSLSMSKSTLKSLAVASPFACLAFGGQGTTRTLGILSPRIPQGESESGLKKSWKLKATGSRNWSSTAPGNLRPLVSCMSRRRTSRMWKRTSISARISVPSRPGEERCVSVGKVLPPHPRI